MHPMYPEPLPFVEEPDRSLVTLEPPQDGDRPLPDHNDREWIDYRSQGGGSVPETHSWTSNPKAEHDEEGHPPDDPPADPDGDAVSEEPDGRAPPPFYW